LCISAFIFFLNSTYVAYPDEFINILGGRAIVLGKLPYRDFFDHHMPFAWYLASSILLFTKQNYILFRIGWGVIQAVGVVLLGLLIARKYPKFSLIYALWAVLYATAAMYFWLHLFLGDSLAVWFFSGAFWMLLLDTTYPTHARIVRYGITCLVTLMIFSSLSYLYIGMIMYAWVGLLTINLYTREIGHSKNKIRELLMLVSVAIAPYVIYSLYLLITGTAKDFWFANFTYNTKLYINIANYTAVTSSFNPLRFALTVINNFWQSYLPLLSQLAYVSFYSPVSRLVALGTLMTALYLCYRRPIFGLIYLALLSFSAPRSSQLYDMRQTDYQMGLFIVMGTISAAYVLYQLLYDLDTKSFFVKFWRSILCFLLLMYFAFSLAFMLQNTLSIRYQRYMGMLPPTTNISDIADFVTRWIEPSDTYWIGPYEGHHAFYVKKGQTAGKYPSLLPQFRENDFLRNDFLHEMEKANPKMIIFHHEASIFQTPAIEFGAFFLDWMKGKYVNCVEARVECRSVVSGINVHEDVYLRLDSKDLFKQM
jgi:hypothetical protein